jgi:hypothetical protein
MPECCGLEFLWGKSIIISLSAQRTGMFCENSRAVGLGKHKDQWPAGKTKKKVHAQNPKAVLYTF